jgi:hemoglobin-like flavoprotein
MTPSEIALVKESFRRIVPIGDQVAALFYARLFDLDPSLRSLVTGDRVEQGRKLMAMLAAAVASLEQLDRIAPALRAVGARHADHGLRERHYPTVGVALLWTLEKCLGESFTAGIRTAWDKTYALLAHTLADANRHVSAAAA